MICLISALLLLRSADALEVPVEVVSPAISIGGLCGELQERTHVGLAASHELRDEIVVIRAKNTTLAQVTENLAEEGAFVARTWRGTTASSGPVRHYHDQLPPVSVIWASR